MRSFHPSIINIAEGSIFRPPGKKIFKKFLGPILRKEPNVTGFSYVSPVLHDGE